VFFFVAPLAARAVMETDAVAFAKLASGVAKHCCGSARTASRRVQRISFAAFSNGSFDRGARFFGEQLCEAAQTFELIFRF
jgi:hypothetical protein